jgi:hypothetical protein
MRIYRLNSHDLAEFWPLLVGRIQEGLKYADGKWSLADLYDEILRQAKQLWVVYTQKDILGCVITEIVKYPQGNRLGIFLLSGIDFDTWYPLRVEIYLWAKDYNCKVCEFYGREGWARKLKNFTLTHVVMKEDIK